jgi:hypothetical protein
METSRVIDEMRDKLLNDFPWDFMNLGTGSLMHPFKQPSVDSLPYKNSFSSCLLHSFPSVPPGASNCLLHSIKSNSVKFPCSYIWKTIPGETSKVTQTSSRSLVAIPSSINLDANWASTIFFSICVSFRSIPAKHNLTQFLCLQSNSSLPPCPNLHSHQQISPPFTSNFHRLQSQTHALQPPLVSQQQIINVSKSSLLHVSSSVCAMLQCGNTNHRRKGIK